MKIHIKALFLSCLMALSIACSEVTTTDNTQTDIPHIQKNGTASQIIAGGKPFLMLGGELHNSTAAGFEYMRPVWKRMADANLNTVIGTASWELVEPEEGKFNFELVDSMILGARKQKLKLVIVWFGSWKNGESTYVPAWVKLDQKRFPLAKNESGSSLNVLTTLSEESCNADAKAFAELMKHIKSIDSKDQTVLTMQVENEIGTLRTKRDYSPVAETAFNGPVPDELISYLDKNKATIHPGVLAAWEKQGFKTSGTWEEVFGKGELVHDWKGMSYLTEELFMAWNYAKYVGKIASAGKAEYNIPMYVNAWLKQPGQSGHAPGNYPSGGPTPQVIDVWRAAAPSIDFIAPDIYVVDQFRYVCDQYTLSGNPLFIPETTGDASSAARAFFAFGHYNTICYAPFGIEGGGELGADVKSNTDMQDAYATLQQLAPYILKNQGTENIGGLLVDDNNRMDSVILGGYKIGAMPAIRYNFGAGNAASTSQPEKRPAGGALIICTAPGEYIIAGRNMYINFSDPDPASNMKVSFLSLEEGRFIEDNWIPRRRLNGDEFRVSLPPDRSRIYKLSLYKY
jgi:hypothetical protein